MRFSDLRSFLFGKMPAQFLAKSIRREVDSYKQQLSKRGSCVPIALTDVEGTLQVSAAQVRLVLKAFMDGHLSKWDVYYLSDAIALSEHVMFTSEQAREAIEEMTDPEVNGDLTIGRAVKILESL